MEFVSPGTWGFASLPGENPWNPLDSSAHWGAASEGASGGAQIYANSLTMGPTDAVGLTKAGALAGDSAYNGSRYAGMVGSTALTVATGGAAAEGNVVARLGLAATTAKIAGDSAVNIGEGTAKIATDPKSAEGYLQTAAGVVGLAATAVSVKAPSVESVSGEAPKTGATSKLASISPTTEANAAETTATRTTLYRAVSPGEFADAVGKQVLRPGPNSYATGKFFAENAADVAKWGKALEGPGNFRIIQVEFESGGLANLCVGSGWTESGQRALARLSRWLP